MAPSLPLVAAIFLAAFILLVSTFIYQTPPKASISGPILAVAGAFSGIRALLSGVIALRTEPFARRMSKGPRFLVGILAGATAVLAATVGLRSFNGRFDSLARARGRHILRGRYSDPPPYRGRPEVSS